MRWRIPRPRFRTATLLVVIALIAGGLGAWKAYWTPSRVWRRAIHQRRDSTKREGAWGQARSGRIDGLSPKQSVEEVARTLEDADAGSAAEAIQAYPLVEPDARVVASSLALRLLDGDPGVRQVAASTMRLAVRPDGSGRKIAFRALIAALDDPDPGVRRSAARSLGEISFKVAASRSFDPRKALRRRLLDPDESVKLAAALALARGGGCDEAVPFLLEFLRGHRDEDCPKSGCSVAFEALIVLAVRSDDAALALIAGVFREGPGRSGEALSALGALVEGDHATRARVIALARQSLGRLDSDLRLAASLVLARVGDGRAAVPALVETLDRGTPKARTVASSALRTLARADPVAIRAASADMAIDPATRDVLRAMAPDEMPP